MSDNQESPAARARLLAEQLRAQGHDTQADHIEATLAEHPVAGTAEEVSHGFLHALRDACQTILTAIEAIDPSSGTAIEELRLEVDKHLLPHGENGSTTEKQA